MPHATTIRIMEYMDEIHRQIGVKFEEDTDSWWIVQSEN